MTEIQSWDLRQSHNCALGLHKMPTGTQSSTLDHAGVGYRPPRDSLAAITVASLCLQSLSQFYPHTHIETPSNTCLTEHNIKKLNALTMIHFRPTHNYLQPVSYFAIISNKIPTNPKIQQADIISMLYLLLSLCMAL